MDKDVINYIDLPFFFTNNNLLNELPKIYLHHNLLVNLLMNSQDFLCLMNYHCVKELGILLDNQVINFFSAIFSSNSKIKISYNSNEQSRIHKEDGRLN